MVIFLILKSEKKGAKKIKFKVYVTDYSIYFLESSMPHYLNLMKK